MTLHAQCLISDLKPRWSSPVLPGMHSQMLRLQVLPAIPARICLHLWSEARAYSCDIASPTVIIKAWKTSGRSSRHRSAWMEQLSLTCASLVAARVVAKDWPWEQMGSQSTEALTVIETICIFERIEASASFPWHTTPSAEGVLSNVSVGHHPVHEEWVELTQAFAGSSRGGQAVMIVYSKARLSALISVLLPLPFGAFEGDSTGSCGGIAAISVRD